MVDDEPHHHRRGMPAARDQPAKRTLDRPSAIDMDVLRVEAAGEVDDLGLGDPDRSVFEDGAGRIILEVAVFDRHGEFGCAQRYLGLDPAIRDCITSTPEESRGCARRGREMNYDY